MTTTIRPEASEASEASGARSKFPRGIWSMGFTELWERYSFYGLQGILSFYLLYSLSEGGLNVSPGIAASIVGTYGGGVYLAQLVGAWCGDRLLSPRYMVLYGAVIIMVGHLALAFTGGLGGLSVGLALIVLGTGALKTNITSIVGFMVDGRPQQERDVSFSYFYMAINVGAVLGPLTTGWVQNQYGFHWGFGLAAVGMAGALIQYIASWKSLPERASVLNKPLPRSGFPTLVGIVVVALAVVALAVWSGLLRAENLATATTLLALVAAAGYFLSMLTSSSVSSAEKRRVTAYLPLFLLSGIYFGLLFQKFTAVSILVTERVDLHIGNWEFPVAWVTTVSPLAGVLATPLIAKIWSAMGSRQPSAVTKFGIGLLQVGFAYLFMLAVSELTGDAVIPLVLVLLFMVIAGSSEVFVGPIGLSLSTRIGPTSFRAQMVGLNFLTLALGSSLSGLLGQLFSAIDSLPYFAIVSGTGLVCGLLLVVFRKPIGGWLNVGL